MHASWYCRWPGHSKVEEFSDNFLEFFLLLVGESRHINYWGHLLFSEKTQYSNNMTAQGDILLVYELKVSTNLRAQ